MKKTEKKRRTRVLQILPNNNVQEITLASEIKTLKQFIHNISPQIMRVEITAECEINKAKQEAIQPYIEVMEATQSFLNRIDKAAKIYGWLNESEEEKDSIDLSVKAGTIKRMREALKKIDSVNK